MSDSINPEPASDEQRISPQRLTRPNGKPYRARRVTAHAWENPDDDWASGVVITGTQDVEAARGFASQMCAFWFGYDYAITPQVGWWRDGYQSGQRWWIDDPVRGAAGIMFTASEFPEPADV